MVLMACTVVHMVFVNVVLSCYKCLFAFILLFVFFTKFYVLSVLHVVM